MPLMPLVVIGIGVGGTEVGVTVTAVTAGIGDVSEEDVGGKARTEVQTKVGKGNGIA